MKWDAVEIKDTDSKSYKGEQAKQFVMRNCPDIPIRTYKLGKISVIINKETNEKSVKPQMVHRVLETYLADKVTFLKVSGNTVLINKPLIPKKSTVNPINLVPQYTITLELGDIDALFEPIVATDEPWKEKGVQQRLQVLGYLYTPLEHPGNQAPDYHHAKACFIYFMQVHEIEEYPAAVAKLKEEIEANIVATGFPSSGEILAKSKLPLPGTMAAIRLPGGYGTTKSAGTELRAGDHFFNDSKLSVVNAKYDFGIGDPRDLIEKVVFDENPLLGKIPLIAKVTATFPGKEPEPVTNASVLFQLAMPDNLPPNSPFSAPPLPDKVMNYSLNGIYWVSEDYPQVEEDANRLNEAEWKAVHRITKKAFAVKGNDAEAKVLANQWIDGWLNSPPVEWDSVKEWWGDEATRPYTRLKSEPDEAKKHIKKLLGIFTEFNGYTEAEYLLIVRLFKAAKDNFPPMQVLMKAKGWMRAWDTAGQGKDVERAEVEAWWGPTTPATYPKMPVSTKPIPPRNANDLTNAQNQFGVIEKYLSPVCPSGFPGDEWAALQKIAEKAKDKNGEDLAAALVDAEAWIDIWAADPRVNWEMIKDWWGNEWDKPYPALRDNVIDKARDRVDFILSHRTTGVTRVNEVTGIAQKKYIDDLITEITAERDALDPQKSNAPIRFGGKAGAAIEKVLEIPGVAQDGFHNKRPTQVSDYGTLNLAAMPADTGKHPHAVECKTNDKGLAGAIFMPAICGGDKYKLRAYIDPDWIQARSPGIIHNSEVQTGTMVVWRNIRLYQHLLLQTTPMNLSPDLQELLREGNSDVADDSKFGQMFLNTALPNVLLIPGAGGGDGPYPPLNISYLVKNKKPMIFYRPLTVNATDFETHFRRGYCELISDTDTVKNIPEKEFNASNYIGRKAFEASGKVDKRIKWDKFQVIDHTSPFLLNLRSAKHYNNLLTEPEKATYPELAEADGNGIKLALNFYYEAMCEYFADGGVLPGLTLIQIPRGFTWDQFAADGLCDSPITSGYGTASRAAYLAWTDGKYKDSFIYPATSNALHEIGHVLGLCHQYDGGGFIDAAHQKAIKTAFKEPSADECVCVMSYTGCYGDFCGKCLLSLRGWKTHNRGDV